MWARLSLKFKLTMVVVTIVAASSYTFGQFMYKGLSDLLDQVLGLRAETVAFTVTDIIDGAWFAGLTLDSLESDTEFAGLVKRMSAFTDRSYFDRVELVRFDEKQKARVLLSVPQDGSVDYKAPENLEHYSPGDLYAMRTTSHHPLFLNSGVHMAAWSPIMHDGEPIGLVVVYISGAPTQNALETASIAIQMTLLAFILLSGLTSFKFAATFEKTAVTDGLMQIYNHKYFKQRLEEEVAKARRYGQATSVVFLDIDFFKRVNDTYGHATGDIVLKQMAKWVTGSTRTTDVVARYGGEEVAVILPHTGIAGAQEFAERLRIKISEQYIEDPEENAKFRVTVSIGVAQWEKGLSMMDLIKRADAALYHSKNTGRNRVTIYQEEILVPAEHASR